ncbi:hypothetical protein YDYSY3_34030 [Paenibacillus chitinolyticus]|nr:hypothetical protein YDYSY3_34030 [Paenibacillus chitinolyticus]
MTEKSSPRLYCSSFGLLFVMLPQEYIGLYAKPSFPQAVAGEDEGGFGEDRMSYGTISKTVPWLKSATFIEP